MTDIVRANVPLWVRFCGNAAPIASMIVSLSPLPTIQEIKKQRSTMNLPLLPYSSMLVNAFLWTSYGFMKNEIKIWSPNAFALLCSIYYIQNFIQYLPVSKNGMGNLPGTVKNHVQIGGSIIAAAAFPMIFAAPETAIDIVGKGGVFICLVLFASPLSALKQVLASRSAATIPLPFTLACFINCVFWSVFGVFELNDFMVYFPNLLGLASAVAQLSLIAIFGNKKSAKDLNLPL